MPKKEAENISKNLRKKLHQPGAARSTQNSESSLCATVPAPDPNAFPALTTQ